MKRQGTAETYSRRIQFVLCLCVAAAFLVPPAGRSIAGQPEWGLPQFRCRQQATIRESALVLSEDLKDFPILVPLRELPVFASLQVTAADGKTVLAHEFTPGRAKDGSERAVWIKAPLVRADADTKFYIYYDDRGDAARAEPGAVWTNGYAAVWHLDGLNVGRAFLPDKPESAKNGRPADAGKIELPGSVAGQQPGVVQGEVTPDAGLNGPALKFGRRGAVLCPAPAALEGIPATGLTVEAWVHFARNPLRDERVTRGIVGRGGFWSLQYHESGRWDFYMREDAPGWKGASVYTADRAPADAWHYLAVVYDPAAQKIALYVDGHKGADNPVAAIAKPAGNRSKGSIVLGSDELGAVKEVRISSVPRSPEWLRACRKTQSSPERCIVLGAKEERK